MPQEWWLPGGRELLLGERPARCHRRALQAAGGPTRLAEPWNTARKRQRRVQLEAIPGCQDLLDRERLRGTGQRARLRLNGGPRRGASSCSRGWEAALDVRVRTGPVLEVGYARTVLGIEPR